MENERLAKVKGMHLSISKKHAVEICSFIRGKEVKRSKAQLAEVIAMKRAIPMKRYKRNIGHKGGMAAGRYPIKASKVFIDLLSSLESNAENKGLDSKSLIIITSVANQASRPFHPGRQRRTKMKRTHVELIAKEAEQGTTKKTEAPKEEVKQVSKVEVKKVRVIKRETKQ